MSASSHKASYLISLTKTTSMMTTHTEPASTTPDTECCDVLMFSCLRSGFLEAYFYCIKGNNQDIVIIIFLL